jgi:hypothetical protein
VAKKEAVSTVAYAPQPGVDLDPKTAAARDTGYLGLYIAFCMMSFKVANDISVVGDAARFGQPPVNTLLLAASSLGRRVGCILPPHAHDHERDQPRIVAMLV